MRAAGRSIVRVLAVAVVLAAPAPSQAQSAAPATVEVPLVYSTNAMTRNADLMLAASTLATSASDAGLAAIAPALFRGQQGSARLARATKLVLFDIPVVAFLTGLNHEWGHQTRSTEYGVDSQLSLVGSPWSSRTFRLEGLEPFPDDPLVRSAIHGGGLEGAHHFKDRAEARMLRAERVAPGAALATVMASLDAPLYALWDLSPAKFNDFTSEGDVITLVRDLHQRRSEFGPAGLEDIRHHVRTRTVLNLVDVALWSETFGVVGDHVWKGEPAVRVRWLRAGGIQLLPSLRYELSPLGPEYYVRSHYRALGTIGTAYGRWTERIGADRQVGGGFSLSRWSTPAILPRVSPRLTVDAWSHTVDGFGMRGEVEADFRGWPHQRAALTVAAGAKSSGYLAGFPMDRGAYVTAGVTMKVW